MAADKYCTDCGTSITSRSVRCDPCHRKFRCKRKLTACKGCGAAFKPKHSNHSTYCSRECAWRYKVGEHHPQFDPDKRAPFSAVYFNTCKQCGKKWIAKRNKSLCSRECELELSRVYSRQLWRSKHAEEIASRQFVTCVGCGELFRPTHGRSFCSERCSDRVYGLSGHYGMSIKEWARIRVSVLERDGYQCHLCGLATDPYADVNDDRYPNADHVVPVSKGGPSSMSNLRCAHRRCNIVKSNAVPHGAVWSVAPVDAGYSLFDDCNDLSDSELREARARNAVRLKTAREERYKG